MLVGSAAVVLDPFGIALVARGQASKDADSARKAKIYADIGLRLTYHPSETESPGHVCS